MPWDPVLVVTFWVLVLHTRTTQDDIARIVSHFDGYSGTRHTDLILLWGALYCNLQEWPDLIYRYRTEDALVQDIVAAVEHGRPKIPAFPRELEPGAPCSERDLEEVRAWMCYCWEPDALREDSGVSKPGTSWLLDGVELGGQASTVSERGLIRAVPRAY